MNPSLFKILAIAGPVIYVATFIFWLIISLILNYHWKSYGITPERIRKIQLIYFGKSALLWIIASAALLYFAL